MANHPVLTVLNVNTRKTHPAKTSSDGSIYTFVENQNEISDKLFTVQLDEDLTNGISASLTRSVITGECEFGGYRNVKITPNDELYVNTHASVKTNTLHYSKSITSTEYFMLVDLSDTTNFTHTETDHVKLDKICGSIKYDSNSAESELKIGVITRIDTQASGNGIDIDYVYNFKSGVQNAKNSLNFDNDFEPKSINCGVSGSTLTKVMTNDKEDGLITFDSDVNPMNSFNGLTPYPEVGDIVLKSVYNTSNYDFALNLEYHTE